MTLSTRNDTATAMLLQDIYSAGIRPRFNLVIDIPSTPHGTPDVCHGGNRWRQRQRNQTSLE